MDEPSDARNSTKVKELTERAAAWTSSGDKQRAFECYHDAYKHSMEGGSWQEVLTCACNYGASCLVNNRTDEAIDLLEEYLKQVRKTDDEDENFFTLIGDVHYNLALAYNIKGNLKFAISHFTSAIQIFETHGATKPLAESYQQLGDVLVKYSERSEAANAYDLSAKAFRAVQDSVSEGRIHIKLAKLHLDNKEAEECLKQLYRCEQSFAKIGEIDKSSSTTTRLMYNLAMTFKKVKEREKALEWLQQAEGAIPSTAPTNADVKLRAVVAQSLGKLFMEGRNYIKAIEKYQHAAAYFGQLGDQKSRAWCLYHLGGIYLLMKDSKRAEKNYHVAYQMLEDAGKVGHLWKVKEGLGDLSAATYQYSSAVTCYRETLTLIGIHSSRNTSHDQKRIMDKLTTVLASKKNGRKEDIHISYSNRQPVVLPMNIGATLEYSSIGISGPAVVVGPDTSTPKSKERKKSKHKGKKKGQKRADMLHKPVPNGVSEYDSDSDLALMEREMLKQLSLTLERTNSLPQNLGSTYEVLGEGRSLQRTASQEQRLRRYSHNVRQTAGSDNIEEERRKSWRIFRGRKTSKSSSSSGSSRSSSSLNSHNHSTAETQTIPLYATIDKKKTGELTTNYFTNSAEFTGGSRTMPSRMAPDPPEGPTDLQLTSDYQLAGPSNGPPTLPPMENHPLVMRGDHSRVDHSRGDHSKSSLTDEGSSHGDSTIPSQWTPEDPPALPPMENHPLVMKKHGSLSDDVDSVPDTPTGVNGGQRGEEIYELADASWRQQGLSSSHHQHGKLVKGKSHIRGSRMCLVM